MTLDERLTIVQTPTVGRNPYSWLPDEILAAMRRCAEERENLRHRIEPMYPHDVWVYMEGKLPSAVTMRKYMRKLVEVGKLLRVSYRGGYLLPEYAHVLNAGHN